MKIKDISWLLLVVLTMATLGTSQPQDEEEAEELPDAEPYRMSRPSYNRATFAGERTSSSYDLSKTYDAMIRKSNRVGGSNSLSSRVDQGFSDSDVLDRDDYYDPYGSESSYGGGGGGGGYGGYASESGYGLSCASGYVNASAVALLAFLFLLNIVQDIVEQINTGRRRREVEESESDVFAFIHNGGLSALKEGLPEVVLPLMVDLMEATEEPYCLQRPLCEANHRLSTNYGIVGKVVGSLVSNVVSKAFSGDDTKKFHMALEASSVGRSKGGCATTYRSCGGISYRQSLDEMSDGDETQNPQENEYQNDFDDFRQNQQFINSPHSSGSNHLD